MNAESTENSSDDGLPQIEPLHRHRADVPAEAQHFFDAAPALAVHAGPWKYSRRPRLGVALKIGAVVAGALVAVLVVLDQLRQHTLLEGELVVAGLALAFLVMVLIGSPGIHASRGKIRHQPSGRKLTDHREDYPGNVPMGAAVYAALTQRAITHREILAMSQKNRGEGKLVVTVYWSDRDDVAFAAVHLEHDDDDYVIWPPVPIPPEQVAGLMSSEPNTFDISAATR